MNRYLIVTNVLFFALAVFFGAQSCSSSSSSEDTVVDTTRCAECMDYNKVGVDNQLDFNLLRTMAFKYQNKPTNNGTTRSIWLSLDKLKRFVYQIESNTCKCENELGVRIYYSAYPGDYDWINTFPTDLDNGFRDGIVSRYGSNLYANINTLFMVPTIREGTINYDFDPSKYGCRKLYEGMGTMADTATYLHSPSAQIMALMATNHGDACPPPAPCSQSGAYFDF